MMMNCPQVWVRGEGGGPRAIKGRTTESGDDDLYNDDGDLYNDDDGGIFR